MEHGNASTVIKFVEQKVNYKNISMIIMLKLEKMEEHILGTKA